MKTIIHSIWALKTDLGEINNKTIEFDNEQSIIYDSVHNGTYRIETNKLYISFLCYRFEGYWGDECIFGYISKQNINLNVNLNVKAICQIRERD